MVFNPFLYKNGQDFLEKTGYTFDEALRILDLEINRLKQKIEISRLKED